MDTLAKISAERKSMISQSSSMGLTQKGESVGSERAIKQRKVSSETILEDTYTAICTMNIPIYNSDVFVAIVKD